MGIIRLNTSLTQDTSFQSPLTALNDYRILVNTITIGGPYALVGGLFKPYGTFENKNMAEITNTGAGINCTTTAPTLLLTFGFNKFTITPGTLGIKINSNPPFSYSTSINSTKPIQVGDVLTITLNASGIGTQTTTRTLAIYESGLQIFFDSQLNNLYYTFTVTGNVEIIADLTD